MSWFTGGEHYNYHPFQHCLDGDWAWIGKIVAIDLAIWVGYVIIAIKWLRLCNRETDPFKRSTLRQLHWIFILCGMTYLWSAIDLVWPAWRLLFFFKVVLAYYTYKYVFSRSMLDSSYAHLDRVSQLEKENKAQSKHIKDLQQDIVDLTRHPKP